MADISIADVLRKFINDPDKIEAVTKEGNEYYFKYGKYCFSLLKRHGRQDIEQYGSYSLYLYPHWNGKPSELVGMFEFGNQDEIEMATYNENQFENPADRVNLAKLNQLLSEKYLNLGKIFGDILET
jgi:hypothetical protein